MTAKATRPEDVLAFWRAAGPDKWFNKDCAFDAEVSSRFFDTWQAAADGRLAAWEDTPERALALVLILDQFPRNMFRGGARSYATDALARAVAERVFHKKCCVSAPFRKSRTLSSEMWLPTVTKVKTYVLRTNR